METRVRDQVSDDFAVCTGVVRNKTHGSEWEKREEWKMFSRENRSSGGGDFWEGKRWLLALRRMYSFFV